MVVLLREVRYRYCANDRERGCGAVSFAFFKITLGLSHGVGNMRETEDRAAHRPSESIQCRGFHLDGQRTSLARISNGGLGLAIGRIRRPGRATANGDAGKLRQRFFEKVEKPCVRSLGECRRWKIMVTCTLIAQGTLDQDEIRCGVLFR